MTTKPASQTAVLNLAANSYVQADPKLVLSFLGTSPYTIEGWIFLNGLCEQSIIVSKPGEFSFGTVGEKMVVQRTNQGSPLMTDNVLRMNKWCHVAVSYSESGTLTLYLDGIQVAQMITRDPGIANQGQPFQMGFQLQGRVRELRYWSIWRSPSDIFQNMFTFPGASTSLVADFDFSQYPVTDLSGNNHTIQYMGDEIVAYSDIASPALALLGTGFAEPVHETEINPGDQASPYSIQAWVYLLVTEGTQCIFANGNWSDNTGIAFSIVNGLLQSQRGSPQNVVLNGKTLLQAQTWYNVATVYDGTTLFLYLNGVSEGQMAAPALPPRPEGSPTIGASHDSVEPNPNYFFQGYIQSVTVWNTGLSASDVTNWMYKDPLNQTGLIAYYNFTANPAENLCTTHSLGLVDGAFIDVLHTQASAQEKEHEAPALRKGAAHRAFSKAQVHSPFLSEAHYQSLTDEYAALLTDLVPPESRPALQALFNDNLSQAFAALAGGDIPSGTISYRLVEDTWVFLEHSHGTASEVYRLPVDQADPCLVWLISYVWTILNAFLSVLGIPTIANRGLALVTQWMNDTGLKTFLISTIEGGATGITVILTVLGGVYTFGYMVALLKWVATTLSWWGLSIVIARSISYFVPGLGEAELAIYIANATIAILQVAYAYSQKPPNCYV